MHNQISHTVPHCIGKGLLSHGKETISEADGLQITLSLAGSQFSLAPRIAPPFEKWERKKKKKKKKKDL